MVYAICEVLVPGLFIVESLEAVQAEVFSSLTITIAARKQSTQVFYHGIAPLLIISNQEEIGSSPSVIELSLSENVGLLFPSSNCQDIH